MVDPDDSDDEEEDSGFDPNDSRTWLKKNDALLSQRRVNAP